MASPSQVGNILTQLDKRPDGIAPRTARRMADAFGVTVAELFPEVAGTPEGGETPKTRTPERRAHPAEEASSELRTAMGLAFDGHRHAIDDLRAVDDLLRHDRTRMDLAETDLVAAARRWLDAAHALRERGQEVTLGALLVVLAGPADRRGRSAEKLAALRALAPDGRSPDNEIEPVDEPLGTTRKGAT
jgi:hypothetical protein